MTDQIPDRELLHDLRRLASGEFDGTAFLAKHRSARSPVLDVIWGNLHHYLADADIRAKDPRYKKMQDDELDRLIKLIAGGAAPSELAAITFLRRSK